MIDGSLMLMLVGALVMSVVPIERAIAHRRSQQPVQLLMRLLTYTPTPIEDPDLTELCTAADDALEANDLVRGIIAVTRT